MPLASFLGPFQEVTAAPAAGAANLAAAGNAAAVVATGSSKHLPVSMEQPAPTEWCWAATTAGICTYYAQSRGIGTALSACQVAGNCLYVSCCPEPTDPHDPRNREYALQGALDMVGRLADFTQGVLKFDEIAQEIEAGRPICCHIAWDSSNPDNGHFNAIVGYDAGTGDVDICDCMGNQTLPYQTFLTAYRGSGSWDWTYRTS